MLTEVPALYLGWVSLWYNPISLDSIGLNRAEPSRTEQDVTKLNLIWPNPTHWEVGEGIEEGADMLNYIKK